MTLQGRRVTVPVTVPGVACGWRRGAVGPGGRWGAGRSAAERQCANGSVGRYAFFEQQHWIAADEVVAGGIVLEMRGRAGQIDSPGTGGFASRSRGAAFIGSVEPSGRLSRTSRCAGAQARL